MIFTPTYRRFSLNIKDFLKSMKTNLSLKVIIITFFTAKHGHGHSATAAASSVVQSQEAPTEAPVKASFNSKYYLH